MNDLNYLMDHIILVSNIRDYFEYIFKKHGEKTINRSIRIYVKRTENRIMIKIKTRYCLEFLIPEIMKLLGSTKSKSNITKNENSENVPYSKITEEFY